MKRKRQIEIMAPAGSFESLMAAIQAGADSVYFGIENLNMRAKAANNFKKTELKKVVSICKKAGVKTYLTLNIVLYDGEIRKMKEIACLAKKCGVDAIIAADLAVILFCKQIGMPCHISTMMNVSNYETVKFLANYADTIVLARELTLEQIRNIHKKIVKDNLLGPSGNLIKIELFAHGALCVAISGKCNMSLAVENSSAKRGACYQICRRGYRVFDPDSNAEFIVENKYIMSPKDLCTIGFLDKIIDAGVSILKLEGRGRSADYVYTVTKVYKDAVQAIQNKTYSKEKIKEWEEELKKVFNRGFWYGGYYLGKKLGEWCNTYGSQATKQKVYIGKVTKFYAKSQIAEIVVENDNLQLNSEIVIIGKTTGVMKLNIDSLYLQGQPVEQVSKSKDVTISVPDRVRKNDKVFKIIDRKDFQK